MGHKLFAWSCSKGALGADFAGLDRPKPGSCPLANAISNSSALSISDAARAANPSRCGPTLPDFRPIPRSYRLTVQVRVQEAEPRIEFRSKKEQPVHACCCRCPVYVILTRPNLVRDLFFPPAVPWSERASIHRPRGHVQTSPCRRHICGLGRFWC